MTPRRDVFAAVDCEGDGDSDSDSVLRRGLIDAIVE